MNIPENLPCFPCPHRAACCRWGTYLSRDEYWKLFGEFGRDFVYFDDDANEYRTQVKDGRCAFFDSKNGGCSIHDHAAYPNVCKIFPYRDGRNAELPHAFDATICPEVKP